MEDPMTIEDRLEMLERRFQRSRRNNGLLLGLMAAAATAFVLSPSLGSQESKEPKTLRAGRFELVDDEGRVRGVLGMYGETPTLMLVNEKVETRCALSASKEASGLTLTSPGLKGKQTLATGADGSVISLEDSSGKPRLELSLLRDAPEVWLSDATENARAILRVGKDGPLMRLIENKNEIWSTRK
jgi:hypothetical protein